MPLACARGYALRLPQLSAVEGGRARGQDCPPTWAISGSIRIRRNALRQQDPQTKDDFLSGARYFKAALELAPDSVFDEARMIFCQGRALFSITITQVRPSFSNDRSAATLPIAMPTTRSASPIWNRSRRIDPPSTMPFAPFTTPCVSRRTNKCRRFQYAQTSNEANPAFCTTGLPACRRRRQPVLLAKLAEPAD